jgi:hypothetical protein
MVKILYIMPFNNEISKVKDGSILEEKINLDPQHLKGVYCIPTLHFFVKKHRREFILPHIVHKHLGCCIPPQGDKLSRLEIVEETRPDNKSEPDGRNFLTEERRLLVWMKRTTCKRCPRWKSQK